MIAGISEQVSDCHRIAFDNFFAGQLAGRSFGMGRTADGEEGKADHDIA
jgi:hypothetical protein